MDKELREYLDKRFDGVDKRFDKVEGKLKDHDKRFDRVEEKLKEHDERFDKVEEKLKEHDERFDKVEEKLKEHDGKFDDVKRHFDIVSEGLMHKIEQVAEMVAMNSEKIERLDVGLRKDIKETKDELGAMIKFSYADLDKKITSLDMRVSTLEERVNRIESH